MAVAELEVTAEMLRGAFKAGYHARVYGRRRRPPSDDQDMAQAWICGWDRADGDIYAPWRGCG